MALCKRHRYGTVSSQPGPCGMCEGERLSATDRKQFVHHGFGRRHGKSAQPPALEPPQDEAPPAQSGLAEVRSLSIAPGFDD